MSAYQVTVIMKCNAFTFTWVVLILFGSHVTETLKATGYCEFPDFLWEPREDGREQIWITKALYDGVTSDWTSRQEIKVNPTQYLVTIVTRTPCLKESANISYHCVEKRISQSVICLSEEPQQKYRVQIQRNGKSYFTCVKFMRKNKNIVQVWAADEQKENEDRLCYDAFLDRIPWPWIAKEQREWSFCPIDGGFDFTARFNGNKKQLCSHQWRPSRLESECILGEGIQFFFPDSRCSIFFGGEISRSLYCWGSWMEDNYTFILLAQHGHHPQFVMRVQRGFPQSADKESTAYFYYSPVCPLRGRGKPPNDVHYAQMSLQRSDPGVCYDESVKCKEFAAAGRCTSAALHKFSNYCKKSCGLCGHSADLVPSLAPECYFPKDWRGDWLWYETNRVEDVKIGPGQVSFSHLGSFICKSKHWLYKQYKMMSHYSNGCRPRYTCMQFRKDGKTLKFQLSRSNVGDRSFGLCQFEDDPPPLRGTIRSATMKLLLSREATRFNSCGLAGQLAINVSFPGETSCSGVISDWDSGQCEDKGSLHLSVYPCDKFNWKDYICLSHTVLSEDYAVVHTKEGDLDTFPIMCWIVHLTHGQGTGKAIWNTATLLAKGQCGDKKFDKQAIEYIGPEFTVTRVSNVLSRKCHISQRSSSFRTENPRYAISDALSHDSLNGRGSEVFDETRHEHKQPTKASKADRIRHMHDPGEVLGDSSGFVFSGAWRLLDAVDIGSISIGVLLSAWLSSVNSYFVPRLD